jgi:site-specific recombinase XerD
VFARAPGQKLVSSQATRADLRGMLKKASIDQKISPHKLRHYSACRIMPNLGVQAGDALAW